MKTSVYIAVSMDGFIARKDGGLDWLRGIDNPEMNDFGYSDFMASVDALVMGRKTFETVLTFPEWPYSKPVFVISRSMAAVPSRLSGKAEITGEQPGKILQDLSKKGFGHIYIDGGTTIRGFLEKDLIDEMTLTTVPVILGDGIPLFTRQDKELKFRLIESRVHLKNIVTCRFARDRG